jgi:hypothetical protein
MTDWGNTVTPSTNVDDCTVPEKILLAADQLDQQGHTPFTAETLIVAAWERFPKTFGLRGFAEKHPDSNKILSSLMGEKGLARRGWLVKMGQKMYALTREGRQVIRRVTLQEEEQAASTELQRLRRDQERFLQGLFDSSAVQKFEENRKNELTFADACRFWGITEHMKADQLKERLDYGEETLAELDRAFADADAQMSSGRIITAGDIRVLTNIHRYMEDRFDRHLNLLRSRSSSKK